MDSLTQLALGSAVSGAVLGRSLGRKALLWGAWWGTVPDLDVLFHPWLDPVQQLFWHRGLSHSLLLILLVSWPCGWLVARVHDFQVPVRRCAWMVFWVWLTHVLIDCFTVYGTQVFEPFSHYRIGFNNLFIIDPLYTLPLLAGLAVAWWRSPGGGWSGRANTWGLILSTLYVAFSFGAKAVADSRLEAAYQARGITPLRSMSGPTLLNTVLWRGVAETPDGFWIGYTSLLDPGRRVDLHFVPRRPELVEWWKETREMKALAWFSEGYWVARSQQGRVVVSDIRFGETGWIEGEPAFVFNWEIDPEAHGIRQVRIGSLRRRDLLPGLWDRIRGGETSWPRTDGSG
jgi:inner membrane protein